MRETKPPELPVLFPSLEPKIKKKRKITKVGRSRREFLIGSPEAALAGISEMIKYDHNKEPNLLKLNTKRR